MTKKRKPRAERVVLISVDGMRPVYYLDPAYPAPAMRQLYREGAHAVAVRAVFPALTYPGHTTLVTGALPARHGIVNNRQFEPVTDPPWVKDSSRIRVPALWDAVRARGGTTASVLWPVTLGADIDWNLPEIWPGGEGSAIDALRGSDRPRGLLEELETVACGRLTPENFNNKWISHDLRVALIAEYLFERYRPTLLLVHTQASNQVPQEPDWRNRRRARSVAGSDQIVSMILEVIERTKTWDSTAVIVTGDHGNTEVHTQVRPNVWLAEAGLRGPHLESGDWRATLFALGGSAFLRVRDSASIAEVRHVLDELPAAKRQTFRIVERDELDRLGADPEAPFALAAALGFVIDDRAEAPDLQPNPGMSHGHHPDFPDLHTGFIAKGAGIRAGASVSLLPLTCIAPLVAELLGLDFDAPDGVLYPGLLA
jgi:predicted AlkP superfamily pyrophosphatase or phosphodiesterase